VTRGKGIVIPIADFLEELDLLLESGERPERIALRFGREYESIRARLSRAMVHRNPRIREEATRILGVLVTQRQEDRVTLDGLRGVRK
jgi:hypothetical protein